MQWPEVVFWSVVLITLTGGLSNAVGIIRKPECCCGCHDQEDHQ